MNEDKDKKKRKKFKFDAEKYIYSNIEKKWWAEYYKDSDFQVLSLKEQR